MSIMVGSYKPHPEKGLVYTADIYCDNKWACSASEHFYSTECGFGVAQVRERVRLMGWHCPVDVDYTVCPTCYRLHRDGYQDLIRCPADHE